jgi:hypothetical protein
VLLSLLVIRFDMLNGLSHKEGLSRLNALNKHPAVVAALKRWTEREIRLDTPQTLMAAIQRLRWCSAGTDTSPKPYPLESLWFGLRHDSLYAAQEEFWITKMLLPVLTSDPWPSSLTALMLHVVQPKFLHQILSAVGESKHSPLKVLQAPFFTHTGALKVLDALPHLNELLLNDAQRVPITEGGVQQLMVWAKRQPSDFSLRLQVFRQTHVTPLFWQSLISAPHLTALKMDGCELDERHGEEIVRLIPLCKTLKTLVPWAHEYFDALDSFLDACVCVCVWRAPACFSVFVQTASNR